MTCHETYDETCASCRGRAAMERLEPAELPPGLRRRVLNTAPEPRIRVRTWALAGAVAALTLIVWFATRPPKLETPPTPTPQMWAEIEAAEASYAGAIAELEARVAERSQHWPPELQDTFNTNLAIIDGAIVDTRKAAFAHSERPDVHRFVLAAYQQKVDLLTEAAEWRF